MHSVVAGPKGMGRVVGKIQRLFADRQLPQETPVLSGGMSAKCYQLAASELIWGVPVFEREPEIVNLKGKSLLGTVSTPTVHNLPFRAADFATLTEALDYSAEGDTGANFYTGRGELYATLAYAELRQQSRALARKLLGMGMHKGDHVALVAETNPDFLRFFFACQYAGLVPVSLLAGAILLLSADTITWAVLPTEIPIGVLTALIGGPFFCYLFRKQQTGRN